MGLTRRTKKSDFTSQISLDEHTFLCAMAGNPNVGKSSLFNALTGLRQHTGNWTGKTVGCMLGKMKPLRSDVQGESSGDILLADLPGCYSLEPHSAEEQAALDFLTMQSVTVAVVVCEVSNLARNLLLAYRIRALQKPISVIICINLMDEARRMGYTVDAAALEKATGCPVVLTSARDRQGLEGLKECIIRTCHTPPEESVDEVDGDLYERMQAVSRGCVTGGQNGQKREERMRRQWRIDQVVMGRWTAVPVALLLLGIVFWITVTGANVPSAWLSQGFSYLGDTVASWSWWSYFPWWIKGFLLDGVYRTLTWVVAVMLPPMAIFFPLFTMMEDVGLLPRIAFNFDRCFHGCRACGKQALTMCMGVGCNSVGVTGCRIIDSPRERMIAILTNSLVPCNGKFPTLLVMAAVFFSSSGTKGVGSALFLVAVVFVSIGVTLIVSRVLSGTLLKGETSSFLLELPPYRMPRMGQVLLRSVLDRTLLVLGRAVTVAAPAGGILWVLANITVGEGNLLSAVAASLDGIGWLLCVDGAVLLALFLSIPANELTLPILLMIYSAGERLTEHGSVFELGDLLAVQGWSVWTAVGFMILFLFHMPCSTTLMTVKKETRRWRWTLLAAMIPCVVGSVLCLFLRLLSVWIR